MTKSLARTYFFAGFFHGEMHYWPDNLSGCVRATLSRIIEISRNRVTNRVLSWNVPVSFCFPPAEITFPFPIVFSKLFAYAEFPIFQRRLSKTRKLHATFENKMNNRISCIIEVFNFGSLILRSFSFFAVCRNKFDDIGKKEIFLGFSSVNILWFGFFSVIEDESKELLERRMKIRDRNSVNNITLIIFYKRNFSQ